MDTPEGRAALAAYCVTALEWIMHIPFPTEYDDDKEGQEYWHQWRESMYAWREEWRKYGGLS